MINIVFIKTLLLESYRDYLLEVKYKTTLNVKRPPLAVNTIFRFLMILIE